MRSAATRTNRPPRPRSGVTRKRVPGWLLLVAGLGLLTFAALLLTPGRAAAGQQWPTGQPVTPAIPPPNPPTGTPVLPTILPTPTDSPTATPEFRILAVEVEAHGASSNPQAQPLSLGRVKVGRQVQMSIYVGFSSLPDAAHVSIAASVRRDGRVVYRTGMGEDRSGTGQLWTHWRFTPRKPGQYVVTGRVSVDGQTKSRHTSFVAVPPQGVSFSFDRLETTNLKGRVTRRFSRADRVVVVATITVRHVMGTVRATVGQNLEYSASGRWRPLGRPVQNSFGTTNGIRHYSVSFVPQTPYSPLRMAIEVTIAGKTESKAVSFDVVG